MDFSIDNIIALRSRKEPLPFDFSRALRSVVNTVFNRGIYTVRLGDLIASLKLQLPSYMIGDYSRYFDCEYLYKLLWLLEGSEIVMIPPKVPRNIGENNIIYLMRKPQLQLDADICKVQELISQKKSAHTNRERDAIARAQVKLHNYNVAIRIFEYLGAAQLRPLDANQRSALYEFITHIMLPHDCDRHVRALYSYACDCGSFNYNFDNPKYVSKPLDQAATDQILTIVAKTIAPSHHSIEVPDDFPYKAKLERLYHLYCPEVYADTSTVVREKSVRIPLSNRPLNSLTVAQRRSRLRNYISSFIAELDKNDVRGIDARSAHPTDRASSLEANAFNAESVNYYDRSKHLQMRMGFSEKFLNSIKELSFSSTDRLSKLVAKLDDQLKSDQQTRLMLPDFSQTRLVVYTPNRSHADNDTRKSGHAFMTDTDVWFEAIYSPGSAKTKTKADGSINRSSGSMKQGTLFDGNPAAAVASGHDESNSSMDAADGSVRHDAGSDDVREQAFGKSGAKETLIVDQSLIAKLKQEIGTEEELELRDQYSSAASAAFKHTITMLQNNGQWASDFTVDQLIEVAGLELSGAALDEAKAGSASGAAGAAGAGDVAGGGADGAADGKANRKVRAAAKAIAHSIKPSFSSTTNNSLEAITKRRKAKGQKTKGNAKTRNYRVVPYVFDRLTHLYHSYLVWSAQKDVVLNNPSFAEINLDEDYCSNLERFFKNPISQEERFNKIAVFELILRNFFGEGRLACALNNAGDSDASELQRFFSLTSRDFSLLADANPLPYLYYHSAIYFDKYLQIPFTHFNNELFYLALLSKEPFAINMYLGRIIRKYGNRLADIPKEFYTLLALWLLLFPPLRSERDATHLLSMLRLHASSDMSQLNNVVVLRDLAHRLYLWVEEHKFDEAKDLCLNLVANPNAPENPNASSEDLAQDAPYSEFAEQKDKYAKKVFNDALRLLPKPMHDSVLRGAQVEAMLFEEATNLVSDVIEHDTTCYDISACVRFAYEYLNNSPSAALKVAASFITDAASLLASIFAKMSDTPDFNGRLQHFDESKLNDIFAHSGLDESKDGAAIDYVALVTDRFGSQDIECINKLCSKGTLHFPDLFENAAISGRLLFNRLMPNEESGQLLTLLLLSGSISNARLSSSPLVLKYALQIVANIAVALRGLMKTKTLIIAKDMTRKASFEYSHLNTGANKIELTTFKDIDEHIISRLTSCSICLSLLKYMDKLLRINTGSDESELGNVTVCIPNPAIADDCYDSHYNCKNSPFLDDNIEPLYQDFVRPVMRTMLCDDYLSYYSLNHDVDLSSVFDCDRISSKYEKSCEYNIEGLCFNRFVIDSYVYQGDEQRFAELKRFALNADTAYDIGFADGIEMESLDALSELFKKNLGLQLVPMTCAGVNSSSLSFMRERLNHIKLIEIPKALLEPKASMLYNDLSYSLYCGYIALEQVNSLVPKAKLKGLIAQLVKETVRIHKLEGSNECIAYVYDFFASCYNIIKREDPVENAAFFHLAGDLLETLIDHQKPARLRHFITMAFGYEFVSGQGKDLAFRRYAVLMAKLKFITLGSTSTATIEQNIKSFDEATVNVVKPVKFDMDKIKAKLKESEQVQAVITTLREKEEEEAFRSERIKKIMEANRAEASLTSSNSYELQQDVATLNKFKISTKDAATLAIALAEAAADALITRLEASGTDLTDDVTATSAPSAASADAATGAAGSASAAAATAADASSASVSSSSAAAAEDEHKINQVLNAKLREVIGAVAVQGTDAMVFSEFNGICVSHGLLSGNYAIEEINNYTYDEYDAPVLELDGEGNDAIVYIDTEIITTMHSQCKKG